MYIGVSVHKCWKQNLVTYLHSQYAGEREREFHTVNYQNFLRFTTCYSYTAVQMFVNIGTKNTVFELSKCRKGDFTPLIAVIFPSCVPFAFHSRPLRMQNGFHTNNFPNYRFWPQNPESAYASWYHIILSHYTTAY